MKANNIKTLLMLPILVLLSAGCRKDLCYDHDEHSFGYRLQIESLWEREWERPYGCDWKSDWPPVGLDFPYDALRPSEAEGIAAVLYDEQQGSLVYRREIHMPTDGGHLVTEPATRALLFYSDDSEYIIFNDLASSAHATATTRTRTRASFAQLHASERTVSPPDMLYGHYIGDYQPQRVEGYLPLEVTMRPLVYTYIIRYRIESGAQYVALARGALAGMAESVYLHDGSTDDNCATLLFDCSLSDYGAEARVMSFGVPGFPDSYYTGRAGEQEHCYDLNLELRLTNGRMLTFEFDITEQMKHQPRGGVITVSGISISDTDGKAGGSGFDATVDDWGEQKDIDLPL